MVTDIFSFSSNLVEKNSLRVKKFLSVAKWHPLFMKGKGKLLRRNNPRVPARVLAV